MTIYDKIEQLKKMVFKNTPFELLWEEWTLEYFKSIGDKENYDKQVKWANDRDQALYARIRATFKSHEK